MVVYKAFFKTTLLSGSSLDTHHLQHAHTFFPVLKLNCAEINNIVKY